MNGYSRYRRFYCSIGEPGLARRLHNYEGLAIYASDCNRTHGDGYRAIDLYRAFWKLNIVAGDAACANAAEHALQLVAALFDNG